MHDRQQLVLESFVRILAFTEAHPATGRLRYGRAARRLAAVVRDARELAGRQLSGQALSMGEVRRQRQLIQRLRVHHIRPLVAIARGEVESHSEVRLLGSLRMPPVRLGVTALLQACDAMIEVARTFESELIESGLPADFIARFREVRDELEQVPRVRASHTGSHVGARKGLQVQLRRGRSAVDQLDAVVRSAFDGDEAVLAKWRAAKRVQRLPSGRRAAGATGGATAEALATAEVPVVARAVAEPAVAVDAAPTRGAPRLRRRGVRTRRRALGR
jgi:hypothetical protein